MTELLFHHSHFCLSFPYEPYCLKHSHIIFSIESNIEIQIKNFYKSRKNIRAKKVIWYYFINKYVKIIFKDIQDLNASKGKVEEKQWYTLYMEFVTYILRM
jgi:hypothetical protein